MTKTVGYQPSYSLAEIEEYAGGLRYGRKIAVDNLRDHAAIDSEIVAWGAAQHSQRRAVFATGVVDALTEWVRLHGARLRLPEISLRNLRP